MNWADYDLFVEDELHVIETKVDLLGAKIASLNFKKLIHFKDDPEKVQNVLCREYDKTYSLTQIEDEMIALRYQIEREYTIEFEEDY
jgi:hypothetical protein